MLRNLALLVASALVAKLLADTPLEETLAAFTRDRAVVSSCAKSRLHAKFGQGGRVVPLQQWFALQAREIGKSGWNLLRWPPSATNSAAV